MNGTDCETTTPASSAAEIYITSHPPEAQPDAGLLIASDSSFTAQDLAGPDGDLLRAMIEADRLWIAFGDAIDATSAAERAARAAGPDTTDLHQRAEDLEEHQDGLSRLHTEALRQIGHMRPRTPAGLLAKAQAALHQMMFEHGREGPSVGDNGFLAWCALRDLLALDGDAQPDAEIIRLCAEHEALDAALAAACRLPETDENDATKSRITGAQTEIGERIAALPRPVTLAGFTALARALVSTDAGFLAGGHDDQLMAQALAYGLAAHGTPMVSA